MKNVAIAIDGPSASGKSTIAKLIAEELNFLYVDTGAMYRAFTYACLINNIDPKDEEAACSLIGKIKIAFNDEMDGRDIGSYVLPNAVVKIFQVANADERARRRYKENLEKGIDCTFNEILENVKKRDYIDSHRDFSPLKEAKDSIRIDTTYMSIPEVKNTILTIIKDKGIM